MSTFRRPVWRAGDDRIGHALLARTARRYACGAPTLDERFAWPAVSRCPACDAAVGAKA